MSLKNRIIGRAAVGAAAAALTLAPGASAKTAAASACDAPAAAVFAPWGDNALYQLVDGGGFEAGAPGWSLTGGATVVRDLNDGIVSDGVADEYALELGPTARRHQPAHLRDQGLEPVSLPLERRGRARQGPEPEGRGPVSGQGHQELRPHEPVRPVLPSPAINLVAGQFGDGTTVSLKFRSLDNATVRVDDVYMDPRMHQAVRAGWTTSERREPVARRSEPF